MGQIINCLDVRMQTKIATVLSHAADLVLFTFIAVALATGLLLLK